jgi:uncharacterized circularly permuted ATP-grasp superfamily protein
MTNSSPSSYDEMLDADGSVRAAYAGYCKWYEEQPPDLLRRKKSEAEAFFRRTGITFNVYGRRCRGTADPVRHGPRIITANQWRKLARGIEQRVRALNAFLHDLYHRQEIVRSGRFPERLLKGNAAFLAEMSGFTPPGGVYTHIVGIDLVRTGEDDFMVLEDNARTPSGVSYMLENRETMMAMFPELFTRVRAGSFGLSTPPGPQSGRLRAAGLRCVGRAQAGGRGADAGHLQQRLFRTRLPGRPDGRGTGRRQRPARRERPHRHAHHARVEADRRALSPRRRRISRSADVQPGQRAGRFGIMDVYRAGGITIANAPGTGIADDKAIYSFMPEIVEFYTGEKPILQNVPTWRCSEPEALAYVLEHLAELVVKEVHGSGGYGMLIGPTSSEGNRRVRAKLRGRTTTSPSPRSRCRPCPFLRTPASRRATWTCGPSCWFRPTGWTSPRAGSPASLKKGSLVVNSSQGAAPRTAGFWMIDAPPGSGATDRTVMETEC